MGRWIVNYRQLRKHYTCYRTTNKIYKERDGEVYVQKITTIAGTEWAGLSQEVVPLIPMDAIPCTQSYIGWLYTGYSKTEAVPENNPPNPTLPQHKVSHRNKQIRGDPVKNIRKEIQVETMENTTNENWVRNMTKFSGESIKKP